MPGASSFLGMDQSARKDEVMIRVIPELVIVLASLWLALPAAAQFEIDPDHFDFDARPRLLCSHGLRRLRNR
jgi:hypothetical protein